MDWVVILKFAIPIVLNLVMLFFVYELGRDAGRHEGYMKALNSFEKEIRERCHILSHESDYKTEEKETKEG